MEGFRSNSGSFLIVLFSTLNDKLYTINPYVHAISLNNIISQNHLMTTTCIKLKRADDKDSTNILAFCPWTSHHKVKPQSMLARVAVRDLGSGTSKEETKPIFTQK